MGKDQSHIVRRHIRRRLILGDCHRAFKRIQRSLIIAAQQLLLGAGKRFPQLLALIRFVEQRAPANKH
jgi:hypothetical protein